MKSYIVSYDLMGGKDRESLHDALKKYPKWARIADSTWAVVTPDSAQKIRNDLEGFMDEDDRLLVVRSGVESAWRNTRCSDKWLQRYM